MELNDSFDDEGRFREHCQESNQLWEACLAAEGDWLPQEIVRDIQEIHRLFLRAWERFFSRRFSTRHQLTVVHHDAYLANFLTPRTEGVNSVFMTDWQSPYASIGAYDLVMLCAPFWTPDQRLENRQKETMLRRCLAALHMHGVTNYTWDQLVEDYRWMLMIFMQVAIWDQTNGSERDYWWPKLRSLISAIPELDCLSLLQ